MTVISKLALIGVVLLVSWFQVQKEETFEQVPESKEVVTQTALVTRVIDGDTIEVDINGQIEKVRYIGIDTPEPYRDEKPECFSAEASQANRNLVEGQMVALLPDKENRDQYDRLLRYVYAGDVFVNRELVARGYAEAINIKPNSMHYDEFLILEREARYEGKGMWGVCF